MHRQNQHLGLRTFLQDVTRGVQSIQLRHADVDDRNVRLELSGFFHGLRASKGFSANLPSSLRFHQRSKPSSDNSMIIGN